MNPFVTILFFFSFVLHVPTVLFFQYFLYNFDMLLLEIRLAFPNLTMINIIMSEHMSRKDNTFQLS